ncbi:AI-2E family transporter [Caminicella sporogenes]|uniref:AI-2E family transporter n=1 Tax=Caminicella sporogenes TaxID=166485 RepID=UPI002541C415|nr:AI-2E family transporter [Caminicella sporogenes]WIF95286.1 AI-2E family transporter [Caminicella sporogenes]
MFNNSRIPYINLIPLFIVIFILYRIINHIDVFIFINRDFLTILSPFIWAFAIAYLLNPMMTYLEKKFGLKRVWSILIIYLFTIGLIIVGITIIFPKIIKNIGDILKDLPDYFDKTEQWITSKINSLKLLDKYGVTAYVEENINSMIQKLSGYLKNVLSTAVSKIIIVTSTFLRIILALIISVYILKDKEKFIRGIKRMMYALLNKKSVDNLFGFLIELDQIFSKFIIGKFIDSCIIGILCFVGLIIIDAPYSLLLSIIVGITNMIPYFGPFIGAIPAVGITLFYSPVKALWVLLFILALQQFDGLWLGPKILGDKVGLTPFWIILAIVLGGGAFGAIGMFLGVPILAVIKVFFERYINRKLKIRKLDI